MVEERKRSVNGIDVYFQTNGALRSFCIGAYLRAGCMFETARDNGVSHLYEHAVFRNLQELYGGRLYTLLSANGLSLNACTYREFMCFTVDGVADGVDFAVELLGRLFLPLAVGPEAFETEKQRIACEINEKDEKSSLDWLHDRRCWGDAFPAGFILGRRSNLERISVRALDRFRERIVSAGNLFFYVTGNVDGSHEERVLEAVRRVPVNPVPIGRRNVLPVKPGFTFGRPDIAVRDSDWYRLALSFGFDARRVPMNVRELLYSALYESDDSAFNMALSEDDPTVYSYDGTLEQYDNLGCFKLAYETAGQTVEGSLEGVARAIGRIRRGDFDLALNRKKLETGYELALDSPCDLNWDLAYYNHILESGPADWSRPALGRFETVTMDAAVKAADEIFRRENLVLTLRGDRKKVRLDRIEKILCSFR